MMDLMWLISVLLLGAALGYYISTLRQTRRIFVSSKSVVENAGSSGNKKTKSKEPLEIEKLADFRKNFKMVLVVRNDLKIGKGRINCSQCSQEHVKNMKVSCVGRGLMGYLGNKGSISISMLLHQTSFCFVCTHLTSGQKEGDELKRTFDVMEILKKSVSFFF